MRVAAIDVGTNTAKMVVAERRGARLKSIYEDRVFVRLGEGVDADRRVTDEALDRLVAALVRLRDGALAHGATAIVAGGTSATRDASNRDAIIARVKAKTGLDYTVVSGLDEAALSYLGATSALPGLAGPCTVIDIGGGSTELVGGTRPRAGEAAPVTDAAMPYGVAFDYRASLDVGSVRLTERCFTSQPPQPGEEDAAADLVRAALGGSGVPSGPDRPLVGAAGTTGSLARLHVGFRKWKDVRGTDLRITREEVTGWRRRLATLTFEETLAIAPDVMHGRADIFLAGLVVLDEAMAHLGVPDVRISPRGLRHGVALRALGLA